MSVTVTRGCGSTFDFASTVTPGRAEPSVAVTFPWSAPVCWANRDVDAKINTRQQNSLRRCICLPLKLFVNCWTKVRGFYTRSFQAQAVQKSGNWPVQFAKKALVLAP